MKDLSHTLLLLEALYLLTTIILFSILYFKWRKVKERNIDVQKRFLKLPEHKFSFWSFIKSPKYITYRVFLAVCIIYALGNLIDFQKVWGFISNLDWSNIVENSISALIIGLILALVGGIIWRKQLLYTKKIETYNELIPYLHYVIANIERENDTVESKAIFAKVMIEKILPCVHTFGYYFGDEYIIKFFKLLRLDSDENLKSDKEIV